MSLKHPDRVPVMSQFSFGFMMQQLKDGTDITPMELWNDADRYAEALMWLRERFDFDGILVTVFGHDPNWRKKARTMWVEGVEVAVFADRKETYIDNDLLVGEFFHEFKPSIDTIDIDMDVPEVIDYIPASKGCYIFIHPEQPYRVFDILEEKLQGEYSIHGEVTSALDYLLDLLGYEEALMAMLTDPGKVKQILQKFTDGIVELAKNLCDGTRIDAVKISSPFAGMDFISPEQYREFELPYLTQIASAIEEKGRFAYVHTCGHIDDRLELMADSGVSGIECLDPPPIGNVELEEAFERIGDRLFIKGNVDSVHTLQAGEEVIRKDLLKRIRIGMKNKGFILSTACSIAPACTKESVRAMAEMAKRAGVYPG